ncbi:MAG: hypothetical protein BGO13_03895 [Burkholderiales bacterium 66-5]|nr:MAG: hypothetical protein BGO13_03895 [Burkholderiales bacterium 66-5]
MVFVLGIASPQAIEDHVPVALFLPMSGIAVALTLRWGLVMLPAIAVGVMLAAALTGQSGMHALAETLSVVVMAGLASRLLSRHPLRSEQAPYLRVFRRLALWGCVVGPACGVLTGHLLLWALGGATIPSDGARQHLVQAWMGQALGVLLVTPIGLGPCGRAAGLARRARWQEATALWLLTIAACALIFGYIDPSWAAPLANAYWLFPFVGWSAIRMGLPPTAALLSLVAWLAQWATNQRIGFFAHDIPNVWGFGYWSYMTILGFFGLILAQYVADARLQRERLRIAAATFEITVPVLITSQSGHVLQANTAFLKLSGLGLPQVLQHTPADFLAQDTANPPPSFFTPDAPVEQRLVLRGPHKPYIPVWATVTPVGAEGDAITHYVIALPDITDFEAAQARQRHAEQAQRDALVREVHHRIKNNLQGVVGMLRMLAQQHPSLSNPVKQMATQVQSIAIVHGLQGRSASEGVDLRELMHAVVQGVQQAFNAVLKVNDDPISARLLLAHTEAVPIALVLNELMTNAIKHGAGNVQASLHHGTASATVTLSNPGHWPQAPAAASAPDRHGLDLVRILLPRQGATLSHEARGSMVVTTLTLAMPVVQIVDD